LDKGTAKKIICKTGDMENIKCNNQEIKKVEIFKYKGSKTVMKAKI
jgi:hypothetical protein